MKKCVLFLLPLTFLAVTHCLLAQGTAFTYQGLLQSNGSPASGNYDFTFTLFNNSSTNTGQVGGALTNLGVGVTNGLFSVVLDFGSNYPGASRWLAIGVRTNGGGAFTALNPLQELTPAPYAIMANSASNLLGNLPTAQLSGTVTLAQLPGAVVTSNDVASVNLTGAFSGNGGGLTNLNATQLAGGTIADGRLSTNVALLDKTQTFTGVNTFSNSATFASAAGMAAIVNDSGVVPGIVATGGLATGHMRFRNALEIWPDNATNNSGYLDVRGTNNPNIPTITLTGLTGAVTASNFSGSGSGLTNLNAAQLGNGVISTTVLPGFQSSSNYSTVGGGQQNVIALVSDHSVIAGGRQNNIGSNDYEGTIGGGYQNILLPNASYATIGGGQTNVASGEWAAIGGGDNNTNNGNAGTIAGGQINFVGNNYQPTVGGGYGNTASADYATVSGGYGNTASTNYTTVSGGEINSAGGLNATVAGGYENSATANYSFIGGGRNNTNNGKSATIAGGATNFISGNVAAIGGGYNNTASATDATIAGGFQNTASALEAAVGGGIANQATAPYATVPGGATNVASGTYSFAAGQQAQALHQGAFVWADSQNGSFASTADDQFLIRAEGGVGIGTSAPGGAVLAVQGSIAGGFATPMALFQNNGASTTSPALRVVTLGDAINGAFSVSAQGTGPIAEFGNSNAFVSQLDNNGNWTANSFSGNGSGLTSVNATTLGGAEISSTTGLDGVAFGTNVYLAANPLYLRGNAGIDHHHGLAYCGSGITNFPNPAVQPDGPVLWGFSGGALGVLNGGAQAVLNWNNSGVGIGTSSPQGVLDVSSSTGVDQPQLRLDQTLTNDYARLRFNSGTNNFWDIAVGGNQMNFYVYGSGNIMTLQSNGDLSVSVLNITGGSDVAEPFEISGGKIPKGSVVIIDEDHPGRLKLSDQSYDPRVAGIVSGANGINPGLSLHQASVSQDGQNVALSGRVYVQADASSGAIRPGDLLTTSATPGHAMKVTDHARAQGAIIGKAMSGLKEGTGMVLVLVSLQ